MNKARLLFLSLVFVIVLVVGVWLVMASRPPRETETVRHLVILYTNDEHGWMEATATSGGAAGLMQRWRSREGYRETGPYLVLSGGDRWTGPAISTWFRGESMDDVMEAMGYEAVAIGNHDFDFGLEVLRSRSAVSSFLFLAANIRDKETGSVPDFALPYAIKEINGIKVGLIGLATLETPWDTHPSYVAGLEFRRYDDVLREIIPQVKVDGAELLIVFGHLCQSELRALVPTAVELGVAVMGGGHCHERLNETRDGIVLIESGSFWQGYAKIDLYFDIANQRLVSVKSSLRDNKPGKADPQIGERVSSWHDRADPSLWQVIGHSNKEIARDSPAMAQLLTRAWLAAFPSADAAIASPRYIQQSLPAGNITPATIIGVLPTENVMMDMKLSGEQLTAVVAARHPILGGLIEADINPQSIYHVLIPQALYEGGNYYEVRQYDPEAIDTGIDWRQAVIDWIRSLDTSPEHTLDQVIIPMGGP
jgi:2',3'-cyclic-nucleotide 2'-phosphodiesterase (5'-nucleotidase family)